MVYMYVYRVRKCKLLTKTISYHLLLLRSVCMHIHAEEGCGADTCHAYTQIEPPKKRSSLRISCRATAIKGCMCCCCIYHNYIKADMMRGPHCTHTLSVLLRLGSSNGGCMQGDLYMAAACIRLHCACCCPAAPPPPSLFHQPLSFTGRESQTEGKMHNGEIHFTANDFALATRFSRFFCISK